MAMEISTIGMMTLGIGAEIIYSFAIIFCSLMIFFGTKEIYDLSSYKGLKYFRLAFLFLAISYFFRLPILDRVPLLAGFSVVMVNVSVTREILFLAGIYLPILIFVYCSMMSIFYLIEAVLWKNLKGSTHINYFLHAIAIIIALATVAFNNPLFYLGLNLILFIFAGVSIYSASRKTKSKNNFSKLYILLLVFLVLNIFNILVPSFLEAIKLFLYLISLSVFFVIVYKVLKKSGD